MFYVSKRKNNLDHIIEIFELYIICQGKIN